MRTSIRSSKVRDVRSLHAAVNDSSLTSRRSVDRDIRIQRTDANIPRGITENRVGGSTLCVRVDPTDIRIRGELPDPEVSPSAEHSGTERVHISGDAGGPPGDELGGGVREWVGAVGGVAGAEPVVVDNGDWTVRVHSEEREVQAHVAGVHVGGV